MLFTYLLRNPANWILPLLIQIVSYVRRPWAWQTGSLSREQSLNATEYSPISTSEA